MTTVTTNPGELRSKIGLDNLYVALITQDDASGYAAETPQYLAPSAEASQEPESSFEVQYADNQAYDVMTAEGPTKITLNVTGMGLQMLATITGRVYDASKGIMLDNAGAAPFCALMFRSLKSNNKNRYYCFLKGKFSMPKEEVATLADKPDPKTLQMEFTAIKTVYKWTVNSVTDSFKRIVGDDDATNFTAGPTWFSQVQTPSTNPPSALTLSASSPVTGATGVAVTAALTMTFNNALSAGEEADFILINATTGAIIAGTNAIDETRKIVTVGHSANLTAATQYRIIYTVKDIFGQTLSGTVSFTTA